VSLAAGIFGIQPAKAESIDFGWAERLEARNLDYETAIAVDDSGNVYTPDFT